MRLTSVPYPFLLDQHGRVERLWQFLDHSHGIPVFDSGVVIQVQKLSTARFVRAEFICNDPPACFTIPSGYRAVDRAVFVILRPTSSSLFLKYFASQATTYATIR